MSSFVKRSITALFFVIIVIGSILISKYSFLALFFIITCICLWEYYSLLENHKKKISSRPAFIKYLGIILGGSIFSLFAIVAMYGLSAYYVFIIILFPFFFLITELYIKSNNPFTNVALNVMGLVYVAIPFSIFNFIAFLSKDYDPLLVLGILILVWINDTMAYIIGSKFGKHKLFERISPKKTWEGFIGGVICSLSFVIPLTQYVTILTLPNWLVIAAIIVIFGTLGDLIESMLKRSFDNKDSGGILPGHGGLLDRFDGFIFIMPVVWIYVRIIT